MTTETKIGCWVGAIAMLLIPAFAVLNGWVLSVLWAWFMVPTFGLPRLSIPAAIGIASVVSYLTAEYSEGRKGQDDGSKLEHAITRLLYGLLRPIMALVFGWIIVQFM